IKPPERFCESTINTLRKRFRDGLLTRYDALDITRGQPPGIKRIIVPDITMDEHLAHLECTMQTNDELQTEQQQIQIICIEDSPPQTNSQPHFSLTQHEATGPNLVPATPDETLDNGLELVSRRLERLLDEE
ncbi:hypothetical protein KR215_009954, partial [Drosophila sulfurigaster]